MYSLIRFFFFYPIIFIIVKVFKKKYSKKKFNLCGVNIFAGKTLDPISKFLLNHNLYEKKELKALNLLDYNSDVIEAGGGIGFVSCSIKKFFISKKKKLFILEPEKSKCDAIKKNLISNNVYDNCLIINRGLSFKPQKLFLKIYNFVLSNTFSNNSFYCYFLKPKKEKKFNLVSVNCLIKKYKLKKFQLLLDVEGLELEILTKNISWFKFCKKIIYEDHLGAGESLKLKNFLKNNNYFLEYKYYNILVFKQLQNRQIT
jgi:FkbM family methyltransferase